MRETQPADPDARRTILVIVGVATVAGALLIGAAMRFRPALESWLQQDPRGRLPMVVAVMMLLSAGPVLALSAYLWSLGRRAIRARRYPPPGLRVTRDTPVLSGGAAERLGRALQIFAGVLALVAVVLVFFLWRLMALARPA